MRSNNLVVRYAGTNSKDDLDQLVVLKSSRLSELEPDEVLKHIRINSIVPILVEAYRTAEAQIKHKETSHFKEWVQTVEEMMDAPRHALKYFNLFPDAQDWI